MSAACSAFVRLLIFSVIEFQTAALIELAVQMSSSWRSVWSVGRPGSAGPRRWHHLAADNSPCLAGSLGRASLAVSPRV